MTYDVATQKIEKLSQSEGLETTDVYFDTNENQQPRIDAASMTETSHHNLAQVETQGSELPQQNEDTNTPPAQTSEERERNQRVCRFYKKKSCKYGAKGVGCPFSHPKKCVKFLMDGNRTRGCNKGKNCDLYHPPICRDSFQYRICNKENCKMQHLRGTKRDGDHNETLPNPAPAKFPQRIQSLPRTRTNTRTYANAVQQGRVMEERNRETSQLSTQENFIELKELIQQMQKQIWNISERTQSSVSNQGENCRRCNSH